MGSKKEKTEIELIYQFVGNKKESQQRLDEIFDFLFEKTLERIKVDNLQELSYTYNKLDNKKDNNGKKQRRN